MESDVKSNADFLVDYKYVEDKKITVLHDFHLVTRGVFLARFILHTLHSAWCRVNSRHKARRHAALGKPRYPYNSRTQEI